MAWIILEGLDRSGKSTVGEHFKKQGYQLFHFSAPDKKFRSPGYTGPSYLDELMELYMELSGRDVVFDRSSYGELVWPLVYNREPMLTYEDIDALRELEAQNETRYILMHDPDTNAHWARCVANKEPLNKDQFDRAVMLYESLARQFNFEKKTLLDFPMTSYAAPTPTPAKPVPAASSPAVEDPAAPHLEKLAKANAIRDVLGGRIIKRQGAQFDSVEQGIKKFLSNELNRLLGAPAQDNFTAEEIRMLKQLCTKIKEKGNNG